MLHFTRFSPSVHCARFRWRVPVRVGLTDAQRRETEARLKALDGESVLLKDFIASQKSLGLDWTLPG